MTANYPLRWDSVPASCHGDITGASVNTGAAAGNYPDPELTGKTVWLAMLWPTPQHQHLLLFLLLLSVVSSIIAIFKGPQKPCRAPFHSLWTPCWQTKWILFMLVMFSALTLWFDKLIWCKDVFKGNVIYTQNQVLMMHFTPMQKKILIFFKFPLRLPQFMGNNTYIHLHLHIYKNKDIQHIFFFRCKKMKPTYVGFQTLFENKAFTVLIGQWRYSIKFPPIHPTE